MALTQKPHQRTASTEQRTSWSWKKLFGKETHGANTSDGYSVPTVRQPDPSQAGIARRLSRKVVPGIPRPGTFRRQQSWLRDRLDPVEADPKERRALSVGRRRSLSCRFPSTVVDFPLRLSAPELLETSATIDTILSAPRSSKTAAPEFDAGGYMDVSLEESTIDTQSVLSETIKASLLAELEHRWVLNLTMHFRDKSRREKFFVTFAETPTHWRRVTISLDYLDVPSGSLEEELQGTKSQREKSARIYEAIRESLPDIQFYDTVTNLKLQTENDRLHVHVVEDLSEVISYPPLRAISHLDCRRIRDDELEFDSHLSGFVYKVRLRGKVFIKKEIPGPDTIEEFLYELNALHRLSCSRNVIQFGGVVLDCKGEVVKGLLISFAEQGALIDVIYDGNGVIPWRRRERWAKEIVEGLSEIHEAGFVQGDFTLSNIVINASDNAKIIDINRRGCPVGWEPPEVAALIDSDQRISMYIGVKSDLFQLGMVLYALAMQHDEPETLRPLNLASFPKDIPDYYLDICQRCLHNEPRCRSQALTLLQLFPRITELQRVDSCLTPVVIDVRHADEDLPPAYNSRIRQLHGYATSQISDGDEPAPQRGRSIYRTEEEQKVLAWEVPLPPTRNGSPRLADMVDNARLPGLDHMAVTSMCTM